MTTQQLGIYGSDVYGQGYYGYAVDCYDFGASVICDRTVEAITQSSGAEREVQIGAVVSVGGTDIAESVDSIVVEFSDDRAYATCKIVVSGDACDLVATGDAVLVSVIYRYAEDQQHQVSMFIGYVKRVTVDGAEQKTATVDCYDATYNLLQAAPHNSTISGSAIDAIEDELDNAGITCYVVSIDDFDIPAGSDTSQFSTVADLVNAIANDAQVTAMWTDSNGFLHVDNAFNETAVVGWNVPKTAHANYSVSDDRGSKYKQMTIQGVDGTTAIFPVGSGDVIGSESAAFISDYDLLLARAQLSVFRSERQSRTFETTINPLAKVGDSIQIEHTDGTWFTGRVRKVRHSFGWPAGGWSMLTVEVSL